MAGPEDQFHNFKTLQFCLFTMISTNAMLISLVMRDSFNRTRGPGIVVNISRPTGTFLRQDQRNKDNIFVVRLQFMADTICTGTVTLLCGTRGPWNIDSFCDASCRGRVIFFRGPEDQGS